MSSFSTGGVRVSRIVVWMFACVAGLAAPATSHAQTFTWNQATSGQSWQTATNWSPNTGTPSVASDIAIFGNVLTGANSVSLTGDVIIGELRFEDVNINSTATTAGYTIGSSSQSITFNNGANPSLLNVTGWTLANQTVATNVVIGGTQPLTITNNGAPGTTLATLDPTPPTLTLSGGISATTSGTALNVGGSSNTAISGVIGSSVGTLTKSGSGLLDLTGSTAANAYTGGTVINGGVVKVTNDNQLGNTSGGVTLNGGALFVDDSGFDSSRSFTIGANGGTILTTKGDGAFDAKISGVISGSGKLTFDGGKFIDLLNNNTYTGPTVINNAGVTLIGDPFAGLDGRLSATSSITINAYVGRQAGFLVLNNILPANNNRVNDAAAITLNGGLINFLPGVLSATNETFGNVTVRGFGAIWGNALPGGAAGTMTFGSITRDGSDPFTTLYIGGSVGGVAAPSSSTQITFSSGIANSSGTGSLVAVVPWIGGDLVAAGSQPGFANTLFTYNQSGSTGLKGLDPNGANFEQINTGGSWNSGLLTARNNSIKDNSPAVVGTVTILSLVQNTASGTSSITGTGTLTVQSGTIANGAVMIFNGPTLDFATKTGYLYIGKEFVIAGTSSITGSNGLVVSSMSDDSRNTLNLTNTTNPNTFTGGLYLNGTARVAFDTADTQLGGAGQKISFRGGTLRYTGSSAVTLSQGVTNRPLEMYASGGGMISLEDSAGILTVPGLISGTEQLTVTGPGTLVLTNTANTYAGGTAIGDSIVRIAAPGSLGTGDIALGVRIGAPIDGIVYSGGTLRFDGAGTVTANVKHDFSSTIDTNGNNVTIAGNVSGNGAALTKAGGGTLTFSAANTYTGSTTITGGTLMVTNTTGSGTGYGAVTVKTGATLGGTGAVAGPVSVESGGTLSVGATGGLGTLTLHGATTLASGSNFLTGLAGTTAGTQYGQLVVKPGGSLALGNATFQPTLNYSPTNGDLLFIVNNQNTTGGLSGTFNGLAEGATITFGNGSTAQISYLGNFDTLSLGTGNDIVVFNFVPVPEPASVLAVAVLALAALAWSSRRKVAIAIVR